VIGAESVAAEPVGPRARASTGSRAMVDAICNLLARGRSPAFGNTGHPDDTRRGC
jgi:hypothetical protein